jgi:multidrug efflux pump subunit AcrB
MAANVPLAVTFSTLAAVTVVPWLSHLLLRHKAEQGKAAERPGDAVPTGIERFYRLMVMPLLSG